MREVKKIKDKRNKIKRWEGKNVEGCSPFRLNKSLVREKT